MGKGKKTGGRGERVEPARAAKNSATRAAGKAARGKSGATLKGAQARFTERAGVEEQLAKTNQMLQALVSASPLAIICTDLEGAVLIWNAAAEKIFGWREEEVLGRGLPIIPEEKREEYLRLRDQVETGATYHARELRRQRKDGSTVELLGASAAIRDATGAVTALLGIFEDITERKSAEELLAKSERLLRESQRVAMIGGWSTDIANGTLEWSEETYRRFDKDPATFTPTFEYFLGRIHPEDRPAVLKASQDALERGAPYHIRPRIINENGREWVLEGLGMIERDAGGRPVRFAGTAQDVTERFAAERRVRESEELFRSIFDNIGIGIALIGPNMEILSLNPQIQRWFPDVEAGRHRLCYRSFNVPPRDAVCAYCPTVRTLGDGQVHAAVTDTPSAEGVRHYQIIATPLRAADGSVAAAIEMVEDVTERIRSEALLKKRERQLAESQRIANVGSWEHNLKTGQVIWSDQLFRLCGLDPHVDPADFGAFFNRVHPDDQPALSAAIERTLKEGAPFAVDYRFMLPEGTTRILHAQAELVPDEAGEMVVLRGTAQDITLRKERENRLEQDRRLLELVASTQLDFIRERPAAAVFGRLLGDLLSLTDSEYGFIGEVLTDVAGRPYLKTHFLSNIAWSDETRAFYAEHEQTGFEFHNLDTLFGEVMKTAKTVVANDLGHDSRRSGLPPGHPELRSFLGIPFVLEGRLVGMAGVANRPGGYDEAFVHHLNPFATVCANIIGAYRIERERTGAVEKVRESEEFLRSTLDTVDEGFVVIDRDYRIVTANKAYCAQAARSAGEVVGMRCYEVSHGLDRPCYEAGEDCAVRRVFESGQPHGALHKHTDLDGHVLFVETKGFPIKDASGAVTSVIETINNITEKHLLEEERLKTQKLESIGTLAGGIAHDFNNLLQGIFGYISMAKLTLDQKDRSLAMLEQAERALHQSVNLTTQLLTFSKGGKPVKEPLSLLSVIENAAKFALSGSRSEFQLRIDPGLWQVAGDAGQLGQVIQNIVLNADQAMPFGGRVMIAARNVPATEAATLAGIERRDHVLVSIRDTGLGIPAQHLGKIFDPYFTTKERGSGLGLATSYSIIRNHGGEIRVSSEVGGGTEFILYLPALRVPVAAPAVPVVERAAATSTLKVLVMDDDDIVRNLALDLLRALGHKAEAAAHGEAALERWSAAMAAGRPFDAAILDLTVRGGMGGVATVRRLREIDPGAKAIMSSGYSDDAAVSEHREFGFCGFLKKPYNLRELRSVLQDLAGRR